MGSDEDVPSVSAAGHSVLNNSDLIGFVPINCDCYPGSEWDIARGGDGQTLDRDCTGGGKPVGLAAAHGTCAIGG